MFARSVVIIWILVNLLLWVHDMFSFSPSASD